jgi:hypothetical protein
MNRDRRVIPILLRCTLGYDEEPNTVAVRVLTLRPGTVCCVTFVVYCQRHTSQTRQLQDGTPAKPVSHRTAHQQNTSVTGRH